MSYTMEIVDRGGYLHCKVLGQQTSANVSAYLHEIYLACIERQVPVVLIEENLEGPGLSMMDIFEVVVKGSKETWPHVQRIAYVDVNPAHPFKDNQFAENVAVNRGVNGKVFRTVAEAEQWIRMAEPPAAP